jgi:hypothetical protein
MFRQKYLSTTITNTNTNCTYKLHLTFEVGMQTLNSSSNPLSLMH